MNSATVTGGIPPVSPSHINPPIHDPVTQELVSGLEKSHSVLACEAEEKEGKGVVRIRNFLAPASKMF